MKITNVIYSYFDEKLGKKLTSSEGVNVSGNVTPKKVIIEVKKKWKAGYNDSYPETINIEYEN